MKKIVALDRQPGSDEVVRETRATHGEELAALACCLQAFLKGTLARAGFWAQLSVCPPARSPIGLQA